MSSESKTVAGQAKVTNLSKLTDDAPESNGHSGNTVERRTFLKLAGGVLGVGSIPGLATAGVFSPRQLPSNANRQPHANLMTQNGLLAQSLTINININRADLDDWVLIESMVEHPLVLRGFAPRWVAYNGLALDLDAMLSRQQRGRNALEIWPNHAWTHSVKGALRPLSQLVQDHSQACFEDFNHRAAGTGTRSIQIPCVVNEAGVVQLVSA